MLTMVATLIPTLATGVISYMQTRRSVTERVKDDLRQALEDGVDGYLLWDFAAGRVETPDGGTRDFCSVFGYELGDPVWEKLAAEEGLPPPVPWRE